jgi:hypothetical protein
LRIICTSKDSTKGESTHRPKRISRMIDFWRRAA